MKARCLLGASLLTYACGSEPPTLLAPAPGVTADSTSESSAAIATGNSASSCAHDSCASNPGWPRLVVGIVPAESSSANVAETFDAWIDADGQMIQPPRPNFCPEPIPGVCTFGFVAVGGDVELRITNQSGWQFEQTITMAPMNYCAIDITYLAVVLQNDGEPIVKAPRLMSPCETLSTPL